MNYHLTWKIVSPAPATADSPRWIGVLVMNVMTKKFGCRIGDVAHATQFHGFKLRTSCKVTYSSISHLTEHTANHKYFETNKCSVLA